MNITSQKSEPLMPEYQRRTLADLNYKLLEQATSGFQQKLITALQNPENWLNEAAIYSTYLQKIGQHQFTLGTLMHLWVLARLGRVTSLPTLNDQWPNLGREYLVTLTTPSAKNLPIREKVDAILDELKDFVEEQCSTKYISSLNITRHHPASLFVALGEFIAYTGVRLTLGCTHISWEGAPPPPLPAIFNPVVTAVDALVAKHSTC